MKTNILITGLGYIGFSLCKLLSKDSKYKITIIDNQFYPSRVKWCFENHISFFHRDLFNLKDLLSSVDIVIHTAGITQVPQIKEQSSPEIDNQIYRVGVEGTRAILNNIRNDCLFVHLSTHCVFDGLQEQLFDIDESKPQCPLLSYGQSKSQNEIDLLNGINDYIIFRLASVYGYGEDATRWRILPNLFSKMAGLNETIKVFGTGENIKPLVGLKDVCRAIKYLIESNSRNEIYHLVNEHKTVKWIAEVCREYNPNLIIENTLDKIPNLGYTLSNKKILKTGFQFQQNIKTEIQKMINCWSNKKNGRY